MLTVSEYAKITGISPQAAYKRLSKEPYLNYVYKNGKKTYLNDEILNIKEVAEEPPTEEKETAAAEPKENTKKNPSAELEELRQIVKQLQEENAELKAENKEVYKRIFTLSEDIQKTNSELLNILNNSMQLTKNSQLLMGYDKAAAAEEPQEPPQRSSETKRRQPFKAIKEIISIFR